MAFGTKTNERPQKRRGEAGPGARAQVRYVRISASKVREVLDLIRGEQVARALEILEFSERDAARVVLKGLESAIANAEHNNGIPADELFVSACFADEGPTLKRWRPRARGRATRIRKRTSHITIIVSRLSATDLETLRSREAAGGAARGNRAAAEARRQRVLRSRQAKADKRADEAETDDHDHDHGEHEDAATAAGIVDQQDAVLEEMAEHDDDNVGPHHETEAEAEGIVDPQEAVLEEIADAEVDDEETDDHEADDEERDES
jgi:large subunit ribosomal protein L22